MKRTCVRNVGVNAFLELHARVAAQVIALPVSGTVGAFTPVLFNIAAVDVQLVCRGLVETCKISAQHNEVCAHSQSQSHVVVVNDAAVGADRNINSCLFEIFITLSCNFNYCCSLSAADTLLLTGDTDGTSADTDFNKVCACISQESEAFSVNYVACTDLYSVAVLFTNPCDSVALPFAVALGAVDAENVNACFNKCRNSFHVVTGINTGAYNISLMLVQNLVRI